jgi:hypothetical protein
VVAQLRTIDTDGSGQVAVLGDAIPANLLTYYNVRDLRSYDVLQTERYVRRLASAGYDPVSREFPDRGDAAFVQQLRNLGAEFIISRSKPDGTVQVGLYEIRGAAPPSTPSNAQPPGLLAGFFVSLTGLLVAAAVIMSASKSSSVPAVPDES